ncbi:hypothetical protein LX32DRAFT_189986 [Colletotrichum zoysiae]|uniref:BZIP domain-containing protein n=1 Tax=Colletotrichum zoysiae TaxID=1216348 RepID=A0AAD9HP93_9PEZI|nr:hypothetical protein LX32DRAFT_189986 [Colletotrichum zoysiae]
MTPNIFRIFNPGGQKEDAADKRRKQLRNAQRSYRDRKDRYTKNLEQELCHARASESKLAARCDKLCATVEALTKLLAQCGVTIPRGILEENAEDQCIAKYRDATDATIEIFSHEPLTTAVDLGATEQAHGKVIPTPAKVLESHSASSIQDISRVDESTSQVPNSFSKRFYPSEGLGSDMGPGRVEDNSPCGRICELDPMLVGMEFVLSIESPCLGHLGGNTSNPSEPTGHALTASAQLIFSHTQKTDLPILPSYQDAPSYLLQRLLDLSTDVCSDGELTPTQAWNYIRSRPQFGGIEVQRLRRFAEKLRAEVKCHGFGAVIDAQNFETMVFEDLMFAQDF